MAGGRSGPGLSWWATGLLARVCACGVGVRNPAVVRHQLTDVVAQLSPTTQPGNTTPNDSAHPGDRRGSAQYKVRVLQEESQRQIMADRIAVYRQIVAARDT